MYLFRMYADMVIDQWSNYIAIKCDDCGNQA